MRLKFVNDQTYASGMRISAFLCLLATTQVACMRCFSCANDFVVWNWRHFFLKRNYAIASSDNLCSRADYSPALSKECHSSCFVVYLNGTDRETGFVQTLGVGRGCSAQFLSDEQYNQRSLGVYSKLSGISNYLSHDFDKYEINEYWCFCAGERCNTDDCFSKWRFHSYTGGYYRNSGRRASASRWFDPYGTGIAVSCGGFWSVFTTVAVFILYLRCGILLT